MRRQIIVSVLAILSVNAQDLSTAKVESDLDSPSVRNKSATVSGSHSETVVDARLLQMAQSGAGGIPVLIRLRNQPQTEILERFEQPARLQLQILEARLAEEANAAFPSEDLVEQARRELDGAMLAVRAAAFDEIRRQIDPEQRALESLLGQLGARNIRSFAAINMLAAEVPPAAVEALASHPSVAEIALDEKHTTHLDVSAPSLGSTAFWSAGYTGTGQSVAVIDTGVKTSHPAFSGLTIVSQVFLNAAKNDSCFADNATSGDDLVGHGTHVAGIVASRGASGWSNYFGVARGLSMLYNLKAGWKSSCGQGAQLVISDVLEALDWLVQSAPAVKIVNYSAGATTLLDDDTMARAWDFFADTYALTAAISAGNDGPGSFTVRSPSNAYNVISVAAMDTQRTLSRADDTVASFSSRGPTWGFRSKPDIAAPGAATPAGGIYSANYAGSGFIAMSGTSMAAPHIAGAAALLRHAGVTNPLAIKALLLNTTDTAGWDSDRGWGYANLSQAYAQRGNVLVSSVSNFSKLYRAAAASGLRATLTWNRKVATASSASGCVSDLDLLLYDASTGSLLGFSLSSVDNVEQVNSTVSGQTVLRVKPYNTSCRSPEPFALAASQAITPANGPSLSASCSGPSTVTAGSTFSVSCTVQNNGDLTAFNVQGPLNWSDGSGGSSQSFGTLTPAASSTRTWLATAPATAGSYSLRLDVSSSSYGLTFTGAGTLSVLVQGGSAPAPQISQVSPSSPSASSTPRTLTVYGSGFQSGLTVTAIPPSGTSFTISGSQIQNITSTSFQMTVTLNTAGTWAIRVNNPDGQQSSLYLFVVTSGSTCEYAVSTSSLSVPASGGSVAVRINTASGCAWSFTGLPSWLTVSGASSGSGPATATLLATANTGAVRTAVITVAGISVPIRQLNPGACGGAADCVIRSLAHMAFGQGWTTTLTATNTVPQSAAFSVSFYGTNGGNVSLPFTGGLGRLNTLNDTVPGQGMKYYEAENQSDPIQAGWGLVTAPESLTLHATFRRRTPANIFYEAAVLSSGGYSSFVIPFDATTFAPASAQMFTGIAITNLNPTGLAQVSCAARDQNGALIPGGTLSIPTLNPMADWAGYDFPALAGRRGTLWCTANTLVSVVALRAIGYEAFSTFPVTPR